MLILVHEGPKKKAVVVSMVAYSKQDEQILDMDKFSFAPKSASCTEQGVSLTFVNDFTYYAVKTAWNWLSTTICVLLS